MADQPEAAAPTLPPLNTGATVYNMRPADRIAAQRVLDQEAAMHARAAQAEAVEAGRNTRASNAEMLKLKTERLRQQDKARQAAAVQWQKDTQNIIALARIDMSHLSGKGSVTGAIKEIEKSRALDSAKWMLLPDMATVVNQYATTGQPIPEAIVKQIVDESINKAATNLHPSQIDATSVQQAKDNLPALVSWLTTKSNEAVKSGPQWQQAMEANRTALQVDIQSKQQQVQALTAAHTVFPGAESIDGLRGEVMKRVQQGGPDDKYINTYLRNQGLLGGAVDENGEDKTAKQQTAHAAKESAAASMPTAGYIQTTDANGHVHTHIVPSGVPGVGATDAQRHMYSQINASPGIKKLRVLDPMNPDTYDDDMAYIQKAALDAFRGPALQQPVQHVGPGPQAIMGPMGPMGANADVHAQGAAGMVGMPAIPVMQQPLELGVRMGTAPNPYTVNPYNIALPRHGRQTLD